MFNLNTNISLTRVINLILTIILLGIIVFGWWYLNGINPLDYISKYYSNSVQPKYLFSIYGSPELRLDRPTYTLVDNNQIYVADTNNGRIVIFDYKGKFIKEIGKMGNGKLISPVGLTKVGNDIYVSDSKASKIFIYNPKGEFKGYFEVDQEIVPGSIFYKRNKIYVLDSKSMTLKIYDMSGKLLNSFGGRGSDLGQFYFPYTVYVTEDENIYVADSNNGRIQIFDREGKVTKIINGITIDGQNSFSVPRGIAFDKEGHLFTTEGLNNNISIIGSDGQKIGSFNKGEPADPEIDIPDILRLPTEVFIDENQRLYVTEFGNSRVLVYDLR